MTKGADGKLWFTTLQGVGNFTTTGVFTGYSIGGTTAFHQPYDITVGPDGNVWFLEIVQPNGLYSTPANLEIGKISPAGQISEYPLINDLTNTTASDLLSSGGGLTTGRNGNLYLTENNQIGQVTLSVSGARLSSRS